jgi:CubicO group peptidase (beta-lactamase class C family)
MNLFPGETLTGYVWLVRQWSVSRWCRPGTKFAYSNMDYVIVGAMIGGSGEDMTGDNRRVFTPLNLGTAGLVSVLARQDRCASAMPSSRKTKRLWQPRAAITTYHHAGIAHMYPRFWPLGGWNAGEENGSGSSSRGDASCTSRSFRGIEEGCSTAPSQVVMRWVGVK